jgi:hypothetical protein
VTVRIDEFGNVRGPDRSGKSVVKRSEAKGARYARAKEVRRDRRARVLLTRSRDEF